MPKQIIKGFISQIRGVSYKPTDVVDAENGTPIIRANNIQDDGMIYDDLVFVAQQKIKDNQLLKKGDIVICTSSGSKNLVGKATTFSGYKTDMSFGAFCKVVRISSSSVNPDYIRLFFKSKTYREQISASSTGANINNIKTDHIDNLIINIPPVETQNIAVRELSTLIKSISIKKQQLSALNELVKSRFIEMFVEKGFKEITFSDYAEIIDGDRGKNYPKAEEFSDEGYCLFLSAKNVTKDGFLFEQMQFISEEKDNLLRKGKLCRGDIVITTRGTIGNIAFYDDDIPYDNVRINSGMVIIRQKEVSFNQIFFLNAFKNKIDEIKETNVTGAAQPQLPIHIMSKIKLLNPPIELQNEFADFVKLIDKSKFIVQKQIDDLQELLDSKMDEYFG